MKIKEIKKKKDSYSIYEVIFEPNWLEKLFNIKQKTIEYKQTDSIYTFGGGNVYINKEGKKLGNGNWIGKAIDEFKRKW
jgi:hypothetical protein